MRFIVTVLLVTHGVAVSSLEKTEPGATALAAAHLTDVGKSVLLQRGDPSAAASTQPRVCDDILLGFSPGHVGTTTISNRSTYTSGATRLQSVAFSFELANPHRFFATIEEEQQFARTVYLPALASSIEAQRGATELDGADPVRSCVDLSHYNVYFFRGLIEEMRATSTRFRFVRIRRDAHETSKSLMERNRNRELKGLPLQPGDQLRLAASFHPVRNPRTVLRLTNASATWTSFSVLQQALWVTDETEAQWLVAIDAATRSAALEVAWSKQDVGKGAAGGDPLRQQCAVPIAKSLGLEARPSLEDMKQHIDAKATEEEQCAAKRDLAAYRARMEAVCPSFARLAARLPSTMAYEARAARLYEARAARLAATTRSPPLGHVRRAGFECGEGDSFAEAHLSDVVKSLEHATALPVVAFTEPPDAMGTLAEPPDAMGITEPPDAMATLAEKETVRAARTPGARTG